MKPCLSGQGFFVSSGKIMLLCFIKSNHYAYRIHGDARICSSFTGGAD
jgi:hypothetical protein